VRRGIKEAVENKAQAVILDMDTNGGRGDAMKEIMDLLENFKGETITYVNKNAYSAGAFIAVATKHIYMAPSSVIGAATPVAMSPSGDVKELPSAYQKKISSAFSAQLRVAAQRNGHNPAVVDAMVKETDGLIIDGKEVIKKGEILTLTDVEATTLYGKPPRPLLAEGIAANLDEVLKKFGYSQEQVRRVEPTGAERLARFITLVSPLLLIIGLGGIYLEFKTPGVSLPGIIGVTALAIFFFGHYVAGLSGFEELLLFALGLILIAVGIFLLPGHVLPEFLGTVAVFVAILWAMVDKMPTSSGLPNFSEISVAKIQLPLFKLAVGMIGASILVALLARWLPQGKGPLGGLILRTQLASSSGYSSAETHHELVGQRGVALSLLRPSGTARLGERIVDVMSRGDFIPADQPIVVREVRGAQVIVEKA